MQEVTPKFMVITVTYFQEKQSSDRTEEQSCQLQRN